MNREKIVEAILKLEADHTDYRSRECIREAIKRIVSDASLICFARDLGIDTDAVLNEGQAEATPS